MIDGSFQLPRVSARQSYGAGRSTLWVRGVGAIEANATFGDGVDIGGLDPVAAVGAKKFMASIVGHAKKHMGSPLSLGNGVGGEAKDG